MMRGVARLVALLLLLAVLAAGAACTTDLPRRVATRSAIDQTVRVPMRVYNDVPIVQVSINGAGPLNMIVDTGIASVALSSDVVEQLGLPGASGGSRMIRTGSGFTAIEGCRVATLTLGDIRFTNFDADVLDMPDSLIAATGPVHGLLGLRQFHHTRLTFDYPAGELRIEPATGQRMTGPDVLDGRLARAQHVFVPITVAGEEVYAMLDTGTGAGFLLQPDHASRLTFSHGPRRFGQNLTPTGTTERRLGRLDGAIRVGPHLFVDPIVSIGASPEVLSPAGDQRRFGKLVPLVGGETLRRFVFTLDLSTHQARLAHAPGSQASDAPIRMPSVTTPWIGAQIDRQLDAWIVTEVIEPANAMQAQAIAMVGLRVGDRIVAVQDVPVAELTPDRIQSLIAGRKFIDLTIERGHRWTKRQAPVVPVIP